MPKPTDPKDQQSLVEKAVQERAGGVKIDQTQLGKIYNVARDAAEEALKRTRSRENSRESDITSVSSDPINTDEEKAAAEKKKEERKKFSGLLKKGKNPEQIEKTLQKVQSDRKVETVKPSEEAPKDSGGSKKLGGW